MPSGKGIQIQSSEVYFYLEDKRFLNFGCTLTSPRNGENGGSVKTDQCPKIWDKACPLNAFVVLLFDKDFKSLPGWLGAIVVFSDDPEKYCTNDGRLTQLETETMWGVLTVSEVIVEPERVTVETDRLKGRIWVILVFLVLPTSALNFHRHHVYWMLSEFQTCLQYIRPRLKKLE